MWLPAIFIGFGARALRRIKSCRGLSEVLLRRNAIASHPCGCRKGAAYRIYPIVLRVAAEERV